MLVENESVAVHLSDAMRQMARHPLRLLREWNWKAATTSALLRAGMFFAVNLRSGKQGAVRAMLVEAAYATVAAGLAGAVTQRLRHAEPRGRTAVVVWLLLPTLILSAQAAVHHAMGTPRLRNSMIASFVFAAFATGFNWFAMSRGAFITGEDRSFARDLLLLPKLIVQFLLALPRSIASRSVGVK